MSGYDECECNIYLQSMNRLLNMMRQQTDCNDVECLTSGDYYFSFLKISFFIFF
jgi:hypothetical protein